MTAQNRAPLTGPELVQAVFTKIDTTPERHDQKVYLGRRSGEADLCTSTGCVAGWTALYARPDLIVRWVPHTSIGGGGYAAIADALMDPYGSAFEIDEIAARALGLDEYEADWLFDACRSRSEVLDALQRLLGGHEVLPDEALADYHQALAADDSDDNDDGDF